MLLTNITNKSRYSRHISPRIKLEWMPIRSTCKIGFLVYARSKDIVKNIIYTLILIIIVLHPLRSFCSNPLFLILYWSPQPRSSFAGKLFERPDATRADLEQVICRPGKERVPATPVSRTLVLWRGPRRTLN
jgi:hypothetical protein